MSSTCGVHIKSSTALYICHVPRITWAGPSTSNQQPNKLPHQHAEQGLCLKQKAAPISECVESSRVEVFMQYQEPSSIPNIKSNKFF
eukprot:11614884-Ditylum_brightwellii.AAC.1